MTGILVLDSATGPSLAAAQQAYAAGYRAWLGYVGPSAGWRSAMWPDQCFANVKAAGLAAGAIFFGPDAQLALSECRRNGLKVCFGDVESNDPGVYEPNWIANMNAPGDVLAGPYGLRTTVGGMRAPVHWYAVEQWDGAPMTGSQHGYNATFAGIPVDISTFDPAVFGKAGQVAIQQGDNGMYTQRPVSKTWDYFDAGADGKLYQRSAPTFEAIGTAGNQIPFPDASVVGVKCVRWEDDESVLHLSVVNAVGIVYQAEYVKATETWTNLDPVQNWIVHVPKDGSPGPQGPPGPPGTVPSTATITSGTVKLG